MVDKKKELFSALDEIREAQQAAHAEYEAKNDTWWNGLTEDEREEAFYAVCKRIFEARVKENRSYRGTLYDVFGFDPGMYGRGMDCGYMSLHNIIYDGLELEAMKGVNRFEVIDEEGRTYVNHLNDDQRIKFSLQDDDRTLKVFIDSTSWKEDW